jgi:hypothetical protein
MENDKKDIVTILPPVDHPTKMSTAVCANVFDELETALMFLNVGRQELNPIQRELAERFISTCKLFARDMLAADGDRTALRMVLGLSVSEEVDVTQMTATSDGGTAVPAVGGG